MSEDAIVPIVMFGSLCAIVLLPIYWRAQLRRRVLETVKEMANSGTPMTSELVLNLMGPIQPARPSRERDLRNGYILISLAVAIALIGLAAYVIAINTGAGNESPAVGAGVAAVGAIPGCIGLAFLLLGLSQKRD